MDVDKSDLFSQLSPAARAGAEEKKQTKLSAAGTLFVQIKIKYNVLPRVVPRADVLVLVKDMFGSLHPPRLRRRLRSSLATAATLRRTH